MLLSCSTILMYCLSGTNYRLLSFSISKRKHLRIAPQSHSSSFSYTLDDTTIDFVVSTRDLGVIIDCELVFHSHTNSAISKLLSLISKSLVNLSSDILPILYKSLATPFLE